MPAIEGVSDCARFTLIDGLVFVRNAFHHSMNFRSVVVAALRRRSGRRQIGYARVASDRARFAYLCDVFIDAAHRGRGRSLARFAMSHPEVRDCRTWLLGTRDAHGVYESWDSRRTRGRFMPWRPDAAVATADRPQPSAAEAEPTRASATLRSGWYGSGQ